MTARGSQRQGFDRKPARLGLAFAVAAACVGFAMAGSAGTAWSDDEADAAAAADRAALAADWREDAPTPPVVDFSPNAENTLTRTGLANTINAQLNTVGGVKAVYVADIDSTGKTLLYASNAGKPLILASNQKLFTTSALLNRLGGNGRLETQVFTRGTRSGKNGRVLNGSLVLRGGGDPALATPGFANARGLPLTKLNALATQVKRAGIDRVKKGVLVDDSAFDRKRGVADTGWRSGPYLAPLSGLSFNSGWNGSYHLSAPEITAGEQFRKLLRKRGIKVGGSAKIRRTALTKKMLREKTPVAVATSPTAATLSAVTNKPSNNFYAEMLNKALAIKPGASASTKKGTNRIEANARRLGSGVSAHDGSGLDRRNKASAKNVGRLLVRMQKKVSDDRRDAFWDSLPVAGQEGTVAERMRGTAAAGRCRAKTGTLRDVSSLSGYCRTYGHTIVFSILMNNVTDFYAARLAQDRIAAAVARYRE